MLLPRRRILQLCGAAALPNVPATSAPPPVTAAQIAADTSRPQFHLVGQAQRINDPNGPIYFNGSYHMFYQKSSPGGKHWGHAISPDMIRWQHVPDAIAPTPGTYDGVNCASGGCVIDNGTPTIIYTGFRPEVQCIATSDKDMIVWRKYAGNPVIPRPPAGHFVMPKSSSAAPDKGSDNPKDIALTGFRDPWVWQENGQWMMIVGSGVHGRGGAVLLYQSRDLRKWEYLHPLCVGFRDMMAWGGRPHDTGEVWECPNFFKLGDRHVLVISTMLRTQYFVGRYEGRRFYPEVGGCCDFGHYYAGTSQLDARGKRIQWGWVREMEDRVGWGAAISLPRELTLASDGLLRYAFAPEVESLRQSRISVPAGEIGAGAARVLPEISGDSLDIVAEFDPAGALECGVALRRTPDGAEETRIMYRPADRVLQIDLSRASMTHGKPSVSRRQDINGLLHAPLELPAGEPLRLRLVVDASVIEVIANGRACITARAYPSRPDAVGVALLATGGTARLNRLEAFPMSPISKDRLTT